jgi:hypothetical protein
MMCSMRVFEVRDVGPADCIYGYCCFASSGDLLSIVLR